MCGTDLAPERTESRARAREEWRAGIGYALAAYLWWGFAPFYFKMLAAAPPTLILGHRVVWSVLLLVVMIGIGGQWGAVREVARNGRVRMWLLASMRRRRLSRMVEAMVEGNRE